MSRESTDLSGNWEYQTVAKLGDVPPGGVWGTTYVGTASGVDYPISGRAILPWSKLGTDYWYRTDVNVPSSWSGRAIKIRFESVQHTAKVYVNGQLAGTNSEGYAPFEIDISKYVKVGHSNQILVGVLDARSAAVPSQVAHWFVGIRGKVETVAYRNVRTSDVFVKPSVRNMSLGADVILKNEAASVQAVTVKTSVYDGSSLVKTLPSTEITVDAGGEKAFSVNSAWSKPVFWSPENPKLYILRTEVISGGKVVDTVNTRFGFREFWSIGSDFYLNGTKIRPRAYFCSQWPDEQAYFFNYAFKKGMTTAQAYLQCMANGTLWDEMKKLNVNCIRLFGGGRPSLELDSADEAGMLIVYENVLCSYPDGNTTSAQAQACLTHAENVVKQMRNHPSIIIWSGGNEQFGSCAITKSVCQQQIDVIRATDPTRLVLNSGFWVEPTLGGKALVYDLHYPTSITRGEPSWGLFPDLPNHFYWPVNHSLPIWAQITIGPGLPTSPEPPAFAWKKDRPLLCGESLAAVGEWSAAYHGDDYYLTDWPNIDITGNFDTDYWRIQQSRMPLEIMSAEAYRLSGVSAITAFGLWIKDIPNEFYNQLAKYVLSPMGVFIKEYDNHFFSSSPVTRSIVIWNDGYKTKSLTASYKVKLGKATVLSGRQTVRLGPAETSAFPLKFIAPKVRVREKLSVSLSLLDGAKKVYDRDYVWDVFPERLGVISRASAKFALYDPSRQTRLIMTKSKARFDVIGDFEHLSSYKALVFGINSLSSLSDIGSVASKVRTFVSSGGNVILFEQDSIPEGMLPISGAPLAKDKWPEHSICWTKQGDTHPILSGLEADDLQYWKGDNIVSSRMMAKPSAGNMRILAEAGYDERGLYRTPLLEMPCGRGTYLISQLSITSKYDTEPVAQLLVKNMLEYLLDASHSVARVGILADAKSAFGSSLTQALGVAGDFLTDFNSGYDTLIVDGSTLPRLDAAALGTFVKNGGTLILHSMHPKCQDKLSQLLGENVGITPTSLSSPTKITRDPMTSGIGSYNLYWMTPYVNPDTIQKFAAGGLAFKVTSSNLTALTSNLGLMRANIGRGRVVIDQYLWEDQVSTNNAIKALNYVCTLYTNLGIRMDVSNVRESQGLFIRRWMLVGPFPNVPDAGGSPRTAGYDLDYFPDYGGEPNMSPKAGRPHSVEFPQSQDWKGGDYELSWTAYHSETDAVDLIRALDWKKVGCTVPNNLIAYACCDIHSPSDQDAILAVGSDDGYKAWLNGDLVGGDPSFASCIPDANKLPIKLRKGSNRLLLKITQGTGNWAFCVRILDGSNKPVEGLAVAAR